jgi:dTMP kinase
MLITFEGLDGSGKSTQIALLKESLERGGHDVLLVREPGGTELGEEIRDLVKGHRGGNDNTPIANILLFNAARHQLYTRIIHPALAEGKIVLQDRGRASTTAYQGAGDGMDIETIEVLCDLATNGKQPDLTIFVDVDTVTRKQRIGTRSENSDAFEDKDDHYYERIRAKFLELAEGENWATVDGSGSVHEVYTQVQDAVNRLLNINPSKD